MNPAKAISSGKLGFDLAENISLRKPKFQAFEILWGMLIATIMDTTGSIQKLFLEINLNETITALNIKQYAPKNRFPKDGQNIAIRARTRFKWIICKARFNFRIRNFGLKVSSEMNSHFAVAPSASTGITAKKTEYSILCTPVPNGRYGNTITVRPHK